MKDIKLSISQIDKMKHAIGFRVKDVKKMKFCAYRNRYIVSKKDNDWEYLVSIGCAIRRDFEIEKQIAYYVSELGIKYLSVLFECNIKEID
nr:MAG: hypothetical protein [Bacteriophage sp.]